ncbi:unnamed protein product [Toxocara canis]|uniref:Transthyretin-like family protein n=1 Tax=Toxocara canis TaxID=6265 RepID=A0A183UZH3_TOXCA|nr:unnamed protein product [Toxocara canis]
MLPIFLTIVTLFGSSSALLDQSVAIRGQLLCGEQPSQGDTVKLINHNTITFNNELASGTTDNQGYYHLTGDLMKEIVKDIRREISLGIPDSYVSRSSAPSQTFNGGVLQLQFKFGDEDHKCL